MTGDEHITQAEAMERLPALIERLVPMVEEVTLMSSIAHGMPAGFIDVRKICEKHSPRLADRIEERRQVMARADLKRRREAQQEEANTQW